MFIILGRSSKGECSGLSNAEKFKLYRSKGIEKKKKKDALRKKLWRAKLKGNPMKYEQIRSTNDTANYKTKKTKQLKWKKLVNILQVQTAHSLINKRSIAAYPVLTITYRKVRTKKQKSSKN